MRPPNYRVLLHNDSLNKREYVVQVLLKARSASRAFLLLWRQRRRGNNQRFCLGVRAVLPAHASRVDACAAASPARALPLPWHTRTRAQCLAPSR